jgi:hypothetical protein
VYRSINEFYLGYQPTANQLKDEKGDLLGYFHIILNRWKNYFCQLLKALGANDIRQIEIHTAEILVPEPSACKLEMTTENLKNVNHQVLIRLQQNWLKQEVTSTVIGV